MPGMHDEMTVWENGIKSKCRKYYLIMFLKEVYELFKQSYPDITIGFSKSLRAANVLLKDQHPDMCKCEIHENFLLKIKGLRITYDEHFWPSILCDESLNLTSCWRCLCVNCQLKNKFTIEKNDADTVFWKEWIKTETGHLYIDEKQECVGELKEDLFSEFSFFKEHGRINWIQSTAFTEDKKEE